MLRYGTAYYLLVRGALSIVPLASFVSQTRSSSSKVPHIYVEIVRCYFCFSDRDVWPKNVIEAISNVYGCVAVPGCCSCIEKGNGYGFALLLLLKCGSSSHYWLSQKVRETLLFLSCSTTRTSLLQHHPIVCDVFTVACTTIYLSYIQWVIGELRKTKKYEVSDTTLHHALS